MREIKMRAEYALIKKRASLKKETLLMRLTGAGIFICLLVFVASLSEGDFYFAGYEFSRKILILPSFCGILVLSYFFIAERLYIVGEYYRLSGETAGEPYAFMRFSRVLGFGALLFRVSAVRFLWLTFFLMPSRLVWVIAFRTLTETGNIERLMLITLICAFLLLSAVGLYYYFRVSGRYFLCELLFIRCPGQKPSEIMKNSALLTRGCIGGIFLFSFRNVLKGFSVTGKMRSALFASDLFSDRKFFRNYGLIRPVTYPEHF